MWKKMPALSTTTKYIVLFSLLGVGLMFGLKFSFSHESKEDILASFLINVYAGFLVSFLFILLFVRLFRPKFIISPFICHYESNYYFKIINKSIWHAFDVNIELYILEPWLNMDKILKVNMIPLTTLSHAITSVNRYRYRFPTPLDKDALYAVQLISSHDIAGRLTGDNNLEIRITARHGLSGLSDRFVWQFNRDHIKTNSQHYGGPNINTFVMPDSAILHEI